MARTLVFTIVEADVTAVAELLDERAPRTCELVWARLPLESRLVHGMYSGPELFIMLRGCPGVGAENQVSRPLPGDVGYFHQEPGLYATSPNEVAELVYVYDRGVAIKAAEGQDGFVNLFAQLRLDSAGEFLAASKRVRWDGPFTLRVERGPED
jgi:Protein of unknown function (DUF3830)